jgi:phage baseplate assembly protein gpV
MSVAKNIVRVGTVSSTDYSAGTVRVIFADLDDRVSDHLPVLIPGGIGKINPMPAAGDSVVCLFLGSSQEAGYCIGTFYDESAPGTANECGVYFEDGSYVYYNKADQSLNIKAAGNVKIEGDLIVSGSITRAGELI